MSRVVALAGGVGAARFLLGVVQVVPPEDLTVIVNTGDDRDFFGLRVCPDLDIVTYTLGGVVNPTLGWGYEGDTFEALNALRRLRTDVWFNLGDRDLATHIQRSARLREGAGLCEISAELAQAFGLRIRLLPMTEDPAATMIVREDGSRSDFEEYMVRDGAPDDIAQVDLSAAEVSRPGPGVLQAIDEADTILICPSNPVVSIGTILAVPGVRERLEARRCAIAVSPIIGGQPVKGPADRLLRALGVPVSAAGVAQLYQPICKGMVIDHKDAGLRGEIEALGFEVSVQETLMRQPGVAADMARSALALAGHAA